MNPAMRIASQLSLLGALGAATELTWPLDLEPHAITGTFMEPRSAHYHSGIDLKTAGRIGIPVLAPVAGSVVRIRTSPHGYGKVIYLEDALGRTLVFAHLSRFADRIQTRVTAAQARRGRYQQDLFLPAGQLRVAAGEVIALSGATGTGAPHLHFEVRDTDERPMNPILAGLDVPDETAPTILGLRLVPQAERARVSGGALPVVVAPGETIAASGSVALQVEVVDHTGVFHHRLMPLSVELRVDGETRYRLDQRSFAFSQGRQMRLEVLRESDRRWLRLYRHGPNDLPHRTGEGSWIAEPGQRVEVVVKDAAGHETRADFQIVAASPTSPAGPAWTVTETLLVLRGSADTTLRVSAPPAGVRLLDVDANGVAALPLAQLQSGVLNIDGPEQARDAVLLLGGDRVEGLELAPGVRVYDPTGTATYPGGALWLEPGTLGDPGPEELDLVQVVGRLTGPVAFRGKLELAMPGPVLDGAVVFVVDARGRWLAMTTQLDPGDDAGGTWRAAIDELGLLVQAVDRTPPTLGQFRADGVEGNDLSSRDSTDRPGFTRPRWPAVHIRVADDGAGLEEGAVLTWLSDQPYPARWDPEEEVVVFDWEVAPEPGEHELRIRVTDAVGNATERRARFVLR